MEINSKEHWITFRLFGVILYVFFNVRDWRLKFFTDQFYLGPIMIERP